MDDNLEQPTAEVKVPLGEEVDEEGQSSGDEDEGPDWTKLIPNAARPVIPKRGEKEFEPSKHGGSGLQQHVLQRSRNAMFDALKATRTISNKAISYGTWHPSLSRVSVTISRGTAMNNLGHSVPRETQTRTEDGSFRLKTQKRLELLPEEAIYLIERGSLMCWKESQSHSSGSSESEYPNDGTFESVSGSPMTVQQAYTEMIGKEGLSMDRYQVYAYLKRLGYVVTRSRPPTPFYPAAAPYPPSVTTLTSRPSFIQRVVSFFPSWISRIFSPLFKRAFDWWRPLRISRWLRSEKNYSFIFRSLRFIPAGHKVPIYTPPERKTPPSPYEPFFNLYKPPTPYKKSAPPPPDYQIVVIDARTTPMPTLHELTAMYDNAPELPPPTPRVRNPPQIQGVSYKKSTTTTPTNPAASVAPGPTGSQRTSVTASTTEKSSPAALSQPSYSSLSTSTSTSAAPSSFALSRLLSWPSWLSQRLPSLSPSSSSTQQPPGAGKKQERRLNPFMVLRAGKKTAIIATVDAGTINFFRFAQGAFEMGPWF